MHALSHDMGANFMMLEHSLARLKRRCADHQAPALTAEAEQMEACLQESKRLLNDLVAMAKTGSVDMQPAAVLVSDVVRDVLREQSELLVERGVRVEISDALPVVWCNENRLKQVVTNLVRNAVRHGCDASDPRIRIDRRSTRTDRTAGFSIHDNGAGIPVDQRERIFHPGHRLEGTHGEGSGIGLSIVRETVESFGGRVMVDSDGRSGTTFLVTLPKAPSSPPRPKSPRWQKHMGQVSNPPKTR